MKNSIQDEINNYILKNEIKLNIYGSFFELDLLGTNYEVWCNEHVSEESVDKIEGLIQYIYKVIESKQYDFDTLETKKKQLIKYYKKCNKRIQSNLKRMNDTYGNRIELIINFKEDILIQLETLSEKIDGIEQLIESKASDSRDITNECNSSIF